MNFKTSEDATRCREKLDHSFLGSRRIGVFKAKLQGRDSNVEYYGHSSGMSHGYGPMLL